LKHDPRDGVRTRQQAGDDPDRKEALPSDPQAQCTGELDIAGTHQSGDVEEKKEAESQGGTTQGIGPANAHGRTSEEKDCHGQRGPNENEPVRDTALVEVINRNREKPDQLDPSHFSARGNGLGQLGAQIREERFDGTCEASRCGGIEKNHQKNGDQAGDHAIFNGGRAFFVTNKTSNSVEHD
uniref:Nucleocapsid n=1 Tax=Brugia timori TaxID=42155 RepID=A0A0R3QEL0_9BILA